MQDAVFVATILAFFGLMLLFVRACDWIIGSDEAALGEQGGSSAGPEPLVEQRAA